MKTLTAKQRATWQAIAKDKKHPWYSLAIQALEKERSIKHVNKVVSKMLKP